MCITLMLGARTQSKWMDSVVAAAYIHPDANPNNELGVHVNLHASIHMYVLQFVTKTTFVSLCNPVLCIYA